MRRGCTARRAPSGTRNPISPLQLREKQKARRIYGVQERQFRRYFRSALRVKGQTGVTLLVLLERRLDNVVYRMGLADSRPQARQLVRHGHFMVNGHNHNVPSYLVEIGDVIEVRPTAASNGYFKALADRMGQRTCRNGCSSMRLNERPRARPAGPPVG
jgi:small subunit ribosomal protein S4